MKITLAFDPTQHHAVVGKTLAKMLGRADQTSKWGNTERGYAGLFGMALEQPIPVAALNAAAWEVSGVSNIWIHADPVNIITDQNNAFLMGRVSLDDDEITSLLLDINEFLFSNDCVLFAPKPDQWLLNLSTQPQIVTTPVSEMSGCNIAEKLPEGPDQISWRRLFTELQMLLYTHPVNEKRRAEQRLTVDALWFWGEGVMPSFTATDWSLVVSENSFVNGLAYLTDIPRISFPENFAALLADSLYADTESLIVIPADKTPAEIEKNWITPLFDALQAKAIANLRIIIEKRVFDINAKQSKRWWRKALVNLTEV